jgi:hypothetical protein
MDDAHKYLERVEAATKHRDPNEWKEIEKHFQSLPEEVKKKIIRLQFANIGVPI